MKSLIKYITITLLLTLPGITLGVTQTSYQLLKQSTSFKCQFPKSTSAVWKHDDYKISNGNGIDDEIYFDSINKQHSSARVASNSGSTDAKVFLTTNGLTFLEVTGAGNFVMTTIFPKQAANKKFLATMSRHAQFSHLLAPVVSQNYGFCEIAD